MFPQLIGSLSRPRRISPSIGIVLTAFIVPTDKKSPAQEHRDHAIWLKLHAGTSWESF